jgi:hypothetical protein
VSPKVSFVTQEPAEKNTRSFSVTALPNELLQSTSKANGWNSNQTINPASNTSTHVGGAIRHGTPKKKIFFSEYLKDFDPTISTHKSPFRSSIKDQRDLIGRVSVDESRNKILTPENNSFREFEVKVDNYASNKNDNQERATEKVDSFRTKANPSQTPEKRESFKSSLANSNTQDEINKKLKELRKEEIRSKINKLTEKLYSPSKKVSDPKEDLTISFESPRGFKKDTSFGVKDINTSDNSYVVPKTEEQEEKLHRNQSDYLNVSNLSRYEPQRNESQILNNSTILRGEHQRNQSDLNTSNVSRLLDQQNIELKYKIIIQENENTIFNLKNHVKYSFDFDIRLQILKRNMLKS